ncbi:hypothetical protein EVAR_60966_1 [Eumeta japonica]|uniref:Uncharacterized protein n=1 Tax=Eumeta variegata TaxID=151549 RepID=A0A4C1XXA5_EUMVA|nr:hypothetical protein EVAR_60966_1 [Eumeta japonica]
MATKALTRFVPLHAARWPPVFIKGELEAGRLFRKRSTERAGRRVRPNGVSITRPSWARFALMRGHRVLILTLSDPSKVPPHTAHVAAVAAVADAVCAHVTPF